ncbi:MAG TPA: MFS transporter [Ktedonobacterales bacterium]|nr:MFS transporter [Ktedonobacterales bacterium]
MARDVVEPQMTQLATAADRTMGNEGTGVAPAPPTQPARRVGTFAPLRRRNFSLLFSGQVISMLGDQAYGLALPWTVLVVTGDPRQVGIVLAAGAAPRVVLLLLGGALADRLSPRLVMIFADLMRVVVVGALGVTLIHGLPALWVVALLAGLEGAGTGLFQPGSQAMLPATVPADELPAGNGLMMIIQFLTLIIGPIAGGVATAAQASVAFFADAASFGVSALSLFGIRLPWRTAKPNATADAAIAATPLAAAVAGEGEALATGAPAVGVAPAPTKRANIFGEIGAGFTYAFGNPLLRTAMAMTILGNFAFAGVANVALIVLAHALSPNPLTLGYILAAIGVGGVIGGLSATLLGRAKRRGLILGGMWVIISALMAAATLVAGPAGRLQLGPLGVVQITAVPVDWRAPAVAIVMGLLALLLALTDTTFLTIMQQTIAPEYLARVFSIQFTAGGITQPLSLLLAGVLAATVGPGVVFVGGGVVLLLAVVIGMSSRALRTV